MGQFEIGMLYNNATDWQVIFYIDKEGNEPVKDFILGQPDGAIAEILHLVKLFRTAGR